VHPAFPAPSVQERDNEFEKARAKHAARSRIYAVIASEAKQSISPRRKKGLLRRFAPRNDDAWLFDNQIEQLV
jgi:hypothetical protein